MPTAAQLESAWAAVITPTGQEEWLDGIQLATGIYLRYTVADGKLYQWTTSMGTWAQVTSLATFLAAGAITVIGGTHTRPMM